VARALLAERHEEILEGVDRLVVEADDDVAGLEASPGGRGAVPHLHDQDPGGLGGRVQPVCARNSASLSDGVMYPRVLRGRLLRLRAMRARSAAECTDRSVPLGRYWRSS